MKHRCRAKSPETCPYNASDRSVPSLQTAMKKALKEEDFGAYLDAADGLKEELANEVAPTREISEVFYAQQNLGIHSIADQEREALLRADNDFLQEGGRKLNPAAWIAVTRNNRDLKEIEDRQKNFIELNDKNNQKLEAAVASAAVNQKNNISLGNTSLSMLTTREVKMTSETQKNQVEVYNRQVDKITSNPNLTDEQKAEKVAVLRGKLRDIAKHNLKKAARHASNPSNFLTNLSNSLESVLVSTNKPYPSFATKESRQIYVDQHTEKVEQDRKHMSAFFRRLDAAPFTAKINS